MSFSRTPLLAGEDSMFSSCGTSRRKPTMPFLGGGKGEFPHLNQAALNTLCHNSMVHMEQLQIYLPKGSLQARRRNTQNNPALLLG